MTGLERPATKFDVFLNHRGPDTKLNFVAHLNAALRQNGFYPFWDIESLVTGENAVTSVAAAVQSVSIHVAVFSKGYAESVWCLDELHEMLQTHSKGMSVIIPVFFGVKPEHLRNPEIGPFAAAFLGHNMEQRHDDVERWRKALSQAADITGFVAGDENVLKEKVVCQVIAAGRHFGGNYVDLLPLKLQESVKEVVESLDKMKDGVQILGIVGMGGIGKTTLAEKIFDHYKFQRTFERYTFLRDARTSHILDLQNKQSLVRDLLDVEVKRVDDFRYWFRRINGRKVLIVIDDIDHADQFENLIPDINQLPGGSKVIVTSRHRDVLKKIMGEKNLYEVKELEHLEARKLFNLHAFSGERVRIDFQALAENVADACQGLPLALKVMGCYLRDIDDVEVWKDAHKHIKPMAGILDQLGISFGGLDEEEQVMFLDISCFMIGLHENVAMHIWESCRMSCNPRCQSSKRPNASLDILISRCLVTVDENGFLRVHNLLRDMGQHMATKTSKRKKPGKRSHLCVPTEAEWVLLENQGSDNIRGFAMARSESASSAVTSNVEGFAKMLDLHFLLLDGCYLQGDFSKVSKLLRWLKWSSSPISMLPPSLFLPNLAVLDLTDSSSLTCLWLKDIHVQQITKSLRCLILRNCCALEKLPEDLEPLAGLVVLDLQGCKNLQRLPETLGDLTELEILDLSYCDNLKFLPDSIVNLSKLKNIDLNFCKKLVALPENFGKLHSLEQFWAEEVLFSHLPHSFSELVNLQIMWLVGCTSLTMLPTSMKGFVNLVILTVSESGVTEWPKDIGELSNLMKSGCKELHPLMETRRVLRREELFLDEVDNFRKELSELPECPEKDGILQTIGELYPREVNSDNIANFSLPPGDLGDSNSLKSLDLNSLIKGLGNLVLADGVSCSYGGDQQAVRASRRKFISKDRLQS